MEPNRRATERRRLESPKNAETENRRAAEREAKNPFRRRAGFSSFVWILLNCVNLLGCALFYIVRVIINCEKND